MITLGIIAITVVTSLLAFSNRQLFSGLLFNPYVIEYRKQYYRFITSGLIHADWLHLFFNMYALYLFGSYVEATFSHIFEGLGNILYVALYVSGLIMSQTFSYFKHRQNPGYNAVGASGAIASVIFCCILLYPNLSLYLFLIPIPIPAYIFGPLYLLYSWYMGKRGLDNIGHDAHFFGALWGILFIILLWHEVLPRFFEQIFQ